MNNFLTCLNDIPAHQTYAIFGAGNGGQNLSKLLQLYRKDLTIDCFIDSNKTGDINNIAIMRLADFFAHARVSENDIAILIATEWWYEIEQLLLKNDYCQYYKIPLKFLYSNSHEILQNEATSIAPKDNTFFHLFYNKDESIEICQKLNQVENLLKHNDDKQLFRLITCQNLTAQECINNIIAHYFQHKPTKQYLDFINHEKITTMIDGGVYDGRETIDYIEAFNDDLCIYGFEPNMDVLMNSPYFKKIKNSCFFPVSKGLWSEDKTLFFNQCGQSSHLSNTNNSKEDCVQIDVTSIDNYVKEFNIGEVDFIKMDVEGAELEALKGAVNTINSYRPQLAICIYHKKSHYYEIPLYLNEILEGYSFRFNHYTPGPYESVWYAIPDEVNSASGL